MLEPEVFRKQTYCIEESASVLVTLLGLFSATRSYSAPLTVIRRPHNEPGCGEFCPPCPPCHASGWESMWKKGWHLPK